MTVLTRKDHVGEGEYDSIAWALEVHAKIPDTGDYHFAILYGNEDAPWGIDFFRETGPVVTDTAAYSWRPGVTNAPNS